VHLFSWTASFYTEIEACDIFTLGATAFDKDFVQKYINLLEFDADSSDSSNDTSDLTDLDESDGESSDGENQGMPLFPAITLLWVIRAQQLVIRTNVVGIAGRNCANAAHLTSLRCGVCGLAAALPRGILYPGWQQRSLSSLPNAHIPPSTILVSLLSYYDVLLSFCT
jgi:hypothetical protein